jgi:hypothetical protein
MQGGYFRSTNRLVIQAEYRAIVASDRLAHMRTHGMVSKPMAYTHEE